MNRLRHLLDRLRRHLAWLVPATLLLVGGCAERNEQDGDDDARLASCSISMSESSLSFASPSDIRTVALSMNCKSFNPEDHLWGCESPAGVLVTIAESTYASTVAIVTVDPTALIVADSSLGYALRVCKIVLQIRSGRRERLLIEPLGIRIDLPQLGGTRRETSPTKPRLQAQPAEIWLFRSKGQKTAAPRFIYNAPRTSVTRISPEGRDAAKFTVSGITPPLTIGQTAVLTLAITFSGVEASDPNTYEAQITMVTANGAKIGFRIYSTP